jgi:hypothetical protein
MLNLITGSKRANLPQGSIPHSTLLSVLHVLLVALALPLLLIGPSLQGHLVPLAKFVAARVIKRWIVSTAWIAPFRDVSPFPIGHHGCQQ